MIFLIGIVYDIEAGSMKIIDFKTKLFLDTVIITSDSFRIKGNMGLQSENLVKIMGNVCATSGKTEIYCDSVLFYPSKNMIKIKDNIIIKRESYFFSGEIGNYFIDCDTGYVYNNFFLKTDSSIVRGSYASFNKERIKIFKEPSYRRENLTITSDTIIYNFYDSTAIFLNNVNIKTEEVDGICEELFYDDIKNDGRFYGSPFFVTKTDSIMCDSGYFNFSLNTGLTFNTVINSRTEDGKNSVSGEIAKFFFGKGKLDSLFIFNNTRGELVKYDTLNKKP